MSMIHGRGSVPVTLEELRELPRPEKTSSYSPIPFYDLVELLEHRMSKEFGGPELLTTNMVISKNLKRLFGTITVRNGGEARPTLGFRSSDDRTMSAALAAGLNVMICDNLMVSSDFLKVFRKHTGDAWEQFSLLAMGAIAKLQEHTGVLHHEMLEFRCSPVTQDQGFGFIGMCMGRNVLSKVQAGEAIRQWKKPDHIEFQARSAWSAYNAVTTALKTSPVGSMMQRHTQAHSLAREKLLPV